MKSTVEVVRLLQSEIKATKKCMKQASKRCDYGDALELRSALWTYEFLLQYIHDDEDTGLEIENEK